MAEFYGSVSAADTYHSERGNADWGNSAQADKESALVRASEYVDAQYRNSFSGYRTEGRNQIREWPREWAYVWEMWDWKLIPDDEVPREVERATYEAALRELGEPGFLTPDVIPGQTRKSVSVDGAISVQYWSDRQKPVVEKIDMVLAPLIAESPGGLPNKLTGKTRRG
ncbi:head-tail adaptor Ad1 [Salicola phage CGphi29]|uniref:head-tail adaptor Ad1 n=1 Tax=Salicola phage CGphi29 TaxID=754067 RepID=UPI0002C0A4D7|nr:head-tail adaptor Ad1 [Salicola phage CGphi29]AGH31815.1 hypothetical protein SLPG_00021 [Salicola phage CGphi29]